MLIAAKRKLCRAAHEALRGVWAVAILRAAAEVHVTHILRRTLEADVLSATCKRRVQPRRALTRALVDMVVLKSGLRVVILGLITEWIPAVDT